DPQSEKDGAHQALEHHCSSLSGHRPDRRIGWRLLLGDLLGALLGRRLLGGLLRRLATDQLGGTLADRAGLGRDVAQRLLGQLGGVAEGFLSLRAALLETRLVAQPLQRDFAALDQLVVELGYLVAVALDGLAK